MGGFIIGALARAAATDTITTPYDHHARGTRWVSRRTRTPRLSISIRQSGFSPACRPDGANIGITIPLHISNTRDDARSRACTERAAKHCT
jgi:hypothetical protein